MDGLHPESIVVARGRPPRVPDGPLNAPVMLAAPFHHSSVDDQNRYLRNESNDSIRAFEDAVGALEGGTAIAFASGMAAISAFVEGLPAGTVAVAPESGYSGTLSLFGEQQSLGRMTVRSVPVDDTEAVLAAVPGADVVWLEAVTNPLLGVTDLTAIIDAAKAAGATVGVDATFSTPLNVRPLDLGADVVMHSVTKYLSGHSDLVMGVLVARSDAVVAQLMRRRQLTGAMPGALECYLALRGLRTLAVRMERAQANAAELARRLREHPSVTRVRYPGLPDDPGHAVAARIHRDFGAMVCFEVAGTAEDAEAVCNSVRLIAHTTSLGGVETLIERRARHAIDADHGTPPTLIRMSVGIEHVDDLWADLDQALTR